MRILTHFSKLFVGLLFIVSGLIKANDPLGFSYKLQEYFQVFHMPDFFNSLALSGAVIICVVEIILGVALLIGWKAKLTSWLLLIMIIFFTLLTGYSAVTGKVTDCGCFGDAIKLTPWESFVKDLILLVFILIIFIRRNVIKPFENIKDDYIYLAISLVVLTLFSMQLRWYFPLIFTVILLLARLGLKASVNRKVEDITILISTAFITGFSLYCIWHLPVKDYRPYAEGKCIPEQMTVPEGAPVDVFDVQFIYKNDNTGEQVVLSQEEYMKNWQTYTEANGWKHVDTKKELIIEGYHPPIHDFSISSEEGEDITDQVLNDQGYSFLVISYDISKAEKGPMKEINELAKNAEQDGHGFIGMSGSVSSEVEEFRHDVQAMFKFYSTDPTTLKTIVRSNPGLVLIKNGCIVKKWHHNDIPSYADVKSKYLK